MDWKKVEKPIRDEHERLGLHGRFGAGLPRVSDGSLLFLQHMISKMKDENGGTRIGIVFNGSPLFTGGAGSGESEIRRWLIEHDMLEAIIGLPDQLFYNTGISTYVWIVTNNKPKPRKGKIQLIDARDRFVRMRKSLGNKRNEIGDGKDGKPDQIATITTLYGNFEEAEHSKIFDNAAFGYREITVERPLQKSYQITPERIERLKSEPAFEKLATAATAGKKAGKDAAAGKKLQEEVLHRLTSNQNGKTFRRGSEFEDYLAKILKGLDVPKNVLGAILDAMGEHDEKSEIERDKKGKPLPDPDLRDTEQVPLKEDIHEFFKREVLPHVPDAWIDETRTKIGYEIPFNKHFYIYQPLRPLREIEAEIKRIEGEIVTLLKTVTS